GLVEHDPAGGLGEPPGAGERDADGGVPTARTETFRWAVEAASGVVHEQVDPTTLFDNAFHALFRGAGLADVAHNGKKSRSRCLDRGTHGAEPSLRTRATRDVVAGAREL